MISIFEARNLTGMAKKTMEEYLEELLEDAYQEISKAISDSAKQGKTTVVIPLIKYKEYAENPHLIRKCIFEKVSEYGYYVHWTTRDGWNLQIGW